jgi:hypothetical protein
MNALEKAIGEMNAVHARLDPNSDKAFLLGRLRNAVADAWAAYLNEKCRRGVA